MTAEVKEKLEKQLKMNVNLGQVYLQLSNHAQYLHMNNLACYLKHLSDDKITIHKDLIWQFLNDEGQQFNVITVQCECEPILKPKLMEVKTINDIIEFVNYVEGEVVKEKVQDVAKVALAANDFETLDFWKWFINDRVKDYGAEWSMIYDAYLLEKEYGKDHMDYLKLDKAIGEINKKLGIECKEIQC